MGSILQTSDTSRRSVSQAYDYPPDKVDEKSDYSARSKQMDPSGEPGPCNGLLQSVSSSRRRGTSSIR